MPWQSAIWQIELPALRGLRQLGRRTIARLARAEREELQKLLSERGLDTGPPDGIIGRQSRAAIRAFQRTSGLPEDGYPSLQLLNLLRETGGSGRE